MSATSELNVCLIVLELDFLELAFFWKALVDG